MKNIYLFIICALTVVSNIFAQEIKTPAHNMESSFVSMGGKV